MAGRSPTAHSLFALRKMGYLPGVVERTVPKTYIKQDLFGFLDIVAISRHHPGILGVQATNGSNVSARVQKIIELDQQEPRYPRVWLEAGNQIAVWGWKKKGHRWHYRHVHIDLTDEGPLEAVSWGWHLPPSRYPEGFSLDPDRGSLLSRADASGVASDGVFRVPFDDHAENR